MGTTTEKLQAILNSKTDIKSALNTKYGITVGDKLSDWGNTIRNFAITNVTTPSSIGAYEYYARYGSRTSSAISQTKQEYTDTITSVDLSATTSCGNYGMYGAFVGCSNLTTLTLPPRGTAFSANQYSFYQTFLNCTSLSTPIVLSVYGMNNYSYREMFKGCSSIPSAELYYNNKAISLNASNVWFASMFADCTSMTDFTFSGPKTLTGTTYLFNGTLSNCTSLKRVYITDVKEITTGTASNSTLGIIPNGLTTTSRKLEAIYCPDLQSATVCNATSPSFYSLFMNNTSSTSNRLYVDDIYLPKLTNIGRYAFNYIKNARIHFAAENQSAIESLPNYDLHFSNWDGGTTTFLFDL